MAKTIDINLIVNTAGSEKSIDQANQNISDLKKTIEALGTSSETAFGKKLNDALKESEENLDKLIQSAKNGGKELESSFAAGKAGAEQFSKGSIETLGSLRKELASLVIEIENVPKGTQRWDELNNRISETREAISETEGAFGEAGDTIRTLSGGPVERLRGSFGLLREGILGLDLGKFQTGLKGVTTLFGGLGKAIIATGIGALVLAVIAIINNFKELVKVGGFVGNTVKAIGAVVEILKDGLIQLGNAFGLTAIENDKATESLKKYRLEAANANANIEIEIIKQRLLAGEIDEFEARRLSAIQNRNIAEREALKIKDEAIKAAEEAGDETTEIAIDAALDTFEKTKALIELRYENEVTEANKAEEEKTKKAAEEEEARREKAEQEAEKLRIERERIERENIKKIREIIDENTQTERDKLIRERNRRLNEIKGETLEAEEARRIIIEEFVKKLAELRIKNANETTKKELENLALTISQTPLPPIILGVITPEEQVEVFFENLKQGIDDNIERVSFGLQSLSNLNDAILNLQSSRLKQGETLTKQQQRRAFNRQKSLGIVQAGINTAEAISKAIAIFGPPPSPLGIAGIASAAVTGALQIAAIASKQFNPDSPSVGGGGGISTPSTGGGTNLNALGANTQLSLQPTLQQLGAFGPGSQPQQVFVTETDIKGVLNKVETIEVKNTFG